MCKMLVMTREEAEILALKALEFLSRDVDQLSRFLAVSGLKPAALQSQVGDPYFLGGVLDYLLEDQSMIFLFTESQGLAPDAPEAARRMLPGGVDYHQT